MGDSAVGLIGDSSVAETLTEAGVSVVSGSGSDIPSTEYVIAVGHAALRAVATADRDPIVIPIGAGRGVRSVARDALPELCAPPLEPRVEHHPVLTVSVDGTPVGTAIWDVTVVTTEAARISEYALSTPTDTIGRFRADGVVVATPAGSTGYARRIGGPVLMPSGGVGAVVPIAPFKTNPDHWVLPLDGLSITIQRDEAVVAVYADGERVATVERDDAVRIAPAGTLRIGVTDASRSRFD